MSTRIKGKCSVEGINVELVVVPSLIVRFKPGLDKKELVDQTMISTRAAKYNMYNNIFLMYHVIFVRYVFIY